MERRQIEEVMPHDTPSLELAHTCIMTYMLFTIQSNPINVNRSCLFCAKTQGKINDQWRIWRETLDNTSS